MFRIRWGIIFNVVLLSFSVVAILGVILVSYLIGYNHGVVSASGEYQSIIAKIIGQRVGITQPVPTPTPTPLPKPISTQTPQPAKPKPADWGGPELWVAVNDTRLENGVGQLQQRDELCTIASIRLNEILEIGKLDNHEGFSNLPERREDLKWIFDQYTMAEFLVAGAQSPQDAVDLWYDTLGHKKLLTGGEYSYGCIYAQNTFGVAIAAY